MKVYIASSWRNEHAVRMLTAEIRKLDIEVASFVEEAAKIERLAKNVNRDTLEEWIWSENGKQKFKYDTNNAMGSDAVIYIGPSGTDAWAEVGAAWANGVPIYGLWAKSEPAGLMRRMMYAWFSDYRELLDSIRESVNSRTVRGRS